MKPFNIEISSIEKGPEELKYQIPVKAKVLKQIPGNDRPDYFIAELENSIVWIGETADESKEITHIVICTKYKEYEVTKEMKNTLLAIAYVLDDSLLEKDKLDFSMVKYTALGKASAKGGWFIFG